MSRDNGCPEDVSPAKVPEGDDTGWLAGQDYNARASMTASTRTDLSSDVESDQFEPEYLRWCDEQLRLRDNAYRAWRREGVDGSGSPRE